MRRLYMQIYVTFVGILLLFGVLVSLVWLLLSTEPQEHRTLDGVGALLAELLPGPHRPADELQAALQRLGQLFPVHLTVRGADGALLAAVGARLSAPPPEQTSSGWMRSRRAGPTVALALPDGRWLMVRWQRRHAFGWFGALGFLALAIAVGAYPIVRRMTRRLERLQRQVEALGAGNFSTRVEAEGDDEVAKLAASFNHAAERIARLVDAQRTILAGASHELRSPLARMRIAIELLPGDERPELRARLAQDIAELDACIGELLLASRLDTLGHPEHLDHVDLLALLAEEGTRAGADVSSTHVRRGDEVLPVDEHLSIKACIEIVPVLKIHQYGRSHTWQAMVVDRPAIDIRESLYRRQGRRCYSNLCPYK